MNIITANTKDAYR